MGISKIGILVLSLSWTSALSPAQTSAYFRVTGQVTNIANPNPGTATPYSGVAVSDTFSLSFDVSLPGLLGTSGFGEDDYLVDYSSITLDFPSGVDSISNASSAFYLHLENEVLQDLLFVPINTASGAIWMLQGLDVTGSLLSDVALSANGPVSASPSNFTYLNFIVIDPTGAQISIGVQEVLIDYPTNLGFPYCSPAVPNSTGAFAVLSAEGSRVASRNQVTLHVAGAPPSQFGFFLNGRANSTTMMPAGSVGNLCLSGSIGRYNGVQEVFHTGITGTGALVLDLSQTPTPFGRTTIMGGERWFFQSWYRDSAAQTSNFTNGLEVVFL